MLAGLLMIAFLAVAESHPYTQGHESQRGNEEDDDAFADGALAVFGGGFGGAVAHRAALAECRSAGEQPDQGEEDGEERGAEFHVGRVSK